MEAFVEVTEASVEVVEASMEAMEASMEAFTSFPQKMQIVQVAPSAKRHDVIGELHDG